MASMPAPGFAGSAARTPLAEAFAERIRVGGALTFAEFMRECLYHPQHGYYSRAEARRFADYYTSPEVHPIFGRLLARQLAEMWECLDRPMPFWVVEAGAGTGRLARHILDFAARELPEFYRAVGYVAVEGSEGRRSAQRDLLAAHGTVGRAQSARELPKEIPVGCIFSNELLDAMPVHRVGFGQGKLSEIYVDWDGARFCDRTGAPSTPALAAFFAEQGIELRERQQAEVGLEACEWIERAGRQLGRGFVMTIDYGHEARELYSESHMRGTLLAYRRHRVSEDLYACPGEQDLSAHINFTALDLWGRRGGLERMSMVSQSHFLIALGRGNDFADLYDPGQSEAERVRARLLLKNLISPEGMGEVFRVLVQHKGVGGASLTGLAPL